MPPGSYVDQVATTGVDQTGLARIIGPITDSTVTTTSATRVQPMLLTFLPYTSSLLLNSGNFANPVAGRSKRVEETRATGI